MGRHSAPDDEDDDRPAVDDRTLTFGPLLGAGRHQPRSDDAPTEQLAAIVDDGKSRPQPSPRPASASSPPPQQPAKPGQAPAKPEQAPKKSRAGRNLPAAIGVGLGLGAVGICSLVFYRPSFLAIILLVVGLGMYELGRAISTVEARPPLVPLLAGLAACVFAAWYRGPNGLVVAALITAAGLAVWRLADGAQGYLRDVASSLLVLLYLPLLAGFATMLVHPHDGAARTLAFLGTVVCSDTGGYAAGVSFGRHPLAPMVSKGKTWEGFAGSLIACAICGALLLTLTFHQQWWQGVLFGFAIAITATLGDLGESMIKRDLGLKDMGNLLPGHGGVMDRLDSLLPCAAVAYLLLSAFVPT